MKIYKIKMMSGEEIPVNGDESLQAFLREANSGKKLVVTEYGIVNVASIDSITLHHKKMQEITEAKRVGMNESDVLDSPTFLQLMSGEKKKLTD